MFNTERWSKAMNSSISRSVLLGFPKYSELCSSIVSMIIEEYIYYSFIKKNESIKLITQQWIKYMCSVMDFDLNKAKYLSQFSEPKYGYSIINNEIKKLKNTDLIGIGKSLSEIVS